MGTFMYTSIYIRVYIMITLTQFSRHHVDGIHSHPYLPFTQRWYSQSPIPPLHTEVVFTLTHPSLRKEAVFTITNPSPPHRGGIHNHPSLPFTQRRCSRSHIPPLHTDAVFTVNHTSPSQRGGIHGHTSLPSKQRRY